MHGQADWSFDSDRDVFRLCVWFPLGVVTHYYEVSHEAKMLIAVEECQPTIHISASQCYGRLIECTHPEDTVSEVADSMCTSPKSENLEGIILKVKHCKIFKKTGCILISQLTRAWEVWQTWLVLYALV